MLRTQPTMAEWMCTGVWSGVLEYNMTLQLTTWINPWGLAYALQKHAGAKVTLVDMAGVVNQDIPSVVACDVLKLPCRDVVVNANNETTTVRQLDVVDFDYAKVANANSAPGPTGFNDDELAQAEQLLRQIDCYYFCELGKVATMEGNNNHDENAFRVLYPTDRIFDGGVRKGWQSCCQQTATGQQYGSLDGTAMANRLRNHACRAHERDTSR